MALNLINPSVLNFPDVDWFLKSFLGVLHQGQKYVDTAEPNQRKTFSNFIVDILYTFI